MVLASRDYFQTRYKCFKSRHYDFNISKDTKRRTQKLPPPIAWSQQKYENTKEKESEDTFYKSESSLTVIIITVIAMGTFASNYLR